MRGFGNGRIKKSVGRGEADNGWGVSDRWLARQAIKAKKVNKFCCHASPFGRLHSGRRANVEAAGCCAGRRGALYHTCNAHDITSVCSIDASPSLTGHRCSSRSWCQLSLRAAFNTRQPSAVARFGSPRPCVESVAPRICGLAPKRANID
jgi:hypothetical protein